MNELVYLFELDSVRNSPQEILLGQQALFREIVLKGNHVVLSFNQLTDSESFLCTLRSPDSYNHISSLFSLGAIKYSRFAPGTYWKQVDAGLLSEKLAHCRQSYPTLFQEGVLKERGILPSHSPQRMIRTGSHYIQNGVERCLNSSDERFLFSALPFRSDDKAALSAIHYALQYSDPSILDELLHAVPEHDAQQQERMAFAKAYVELILRLSREPLAYNPANLEASPPMADYLTWVMTRCQTSQQPQDFPLWDLLVQGARQIGRLWPTVQKAGKINDRSDWHTALRDASANGGDKPSVCMAEAIVDLCYNYTVAASIRGLSQNYREEQSFWPDFLRRLPRYWQDGEQGVHQFLKPESTQAPVSPSKKPLPRWDTAVRLLAHIPQRFKQPSASTGAGRDRRRWRWCVASSLGVQIRSAILYIFLFIFVSWGLDRIEERFVSYSQQFLSPLILPLITILVFGIAGSIISAQLHLLDIGDSFTQFGVALRDGAVLLRAWRRDLRP